MQVSKTSWLMCSTGSQITWAEQEAQVPCLWPYSHFCFIVSSIPLLKVRKYWVGQIVHLGFSYQEAIYMEISVCSRLHVKKQWPVKTASPASLLTRKRSSWLQIPGSKMKCREVSEAQGNPTPGRAFALLFGNYQWVITGWPPNRVLSLLKARTWLQNCGVGQVYVGYQPPHLTFQLLSISQNRNLLSLGAGLPGTRLDS